MRLAVRHLSTYRYSRPVPYAIQALRLTPRAWDGLGVIRWQVRGATSRPLASFIDGLGNIVHTNSVNRPHQSTTIVVEGVVETRAAGGLVTGTPEPLPPLYYLRRTAMTAPDAAIRALADGARGARLLDRLMALMTLVGTQLRLSREAEDGAASAAEALAAGVGVARDHAHLVIAACRSQGVPARFVAGYRWPGPDAADRPSRHAWAEAHVDEIGWVGFDPAHGSQPGDGYIRVSIGLDYQGAAPVRGARRGDASETLAVSVDVAAAESAQ
jgi:transglutaminase-like putative cysteine protease